MLPPPKAYAASEDDLSHCLQVRSILPHLTNEVTATDKDLSAQMKTDAASDNHQDRL